MKIFGRSLTLQKVLPWILIIGGVIGIVSSSVLAYDELQLAKDPTYAPGCDINPVVSCGSVTQSAQAHVLGLPNPFYGIAGFAVVITTGATLLAGARLKRWYWIGLQFGAIFGVAFMHWLIFQSLYRLGSLCPYCMAMWVTTITIFWYVTLYNIEAGHIKLKKTLRKVAEFARRHHLDILAFWFLVIFALVLKRFWYYYGEGLF